MNGGGLEVEGLVKRFRGVPAVSGLSLAVGPGEVYGLLGPDGAGKTTALRCLAGVLRADAGRVRVAGFDLSLQTEKARVHLGYMPQTTATYADLTVEENLSFFASLYGAGPEWPARRGRLLRFSRLEEHGGRLAGHLSGGMRQKLALCCALVHSPPVLLLDEPTTGVDAVSRGEFWRLVRQLQAEGSALLVTTAYLEEAERCDRVGFMVGGRLVEEGPPSRLLAALRGCLVRVRVGPGQLMAALDHLRQARRGWTVGLRGDTLLVMIPGPTPAEGPPPAPSEWVPPAGAAGPPEAGPDAGLREVKAALLQAGFVVVDAGPAPPRLEDALAARLGAGGGPSGRG